MRLAIALALAFQLPARGANAFNLVIRHDGLWPVRIFDVGAYACVIAGVLLLPETSATMPLRVRVFLDHAIVTTATITFGWYILLGPTRPLGNANLLNVEWALFKLASDLVAVACLFRLLPHVGRAVTPTTMLMMLLTFACDFGMNLADAYRNLCHLNTWLSFDTAFHACVMLLLALTSISLGQSAAILPVEPVHPIGDATPLGFRQECLPYATTLAAVLLLIYTGLHRSSATIDVGVSAGVATLVVLFISRQAIVLVENRELYARHALAHAETMLMYRETEVLQNELARKNEALVEANARLEALAGTDSHTGMANHRTIMLQLDSEISRARRYGHSFTILFCDIDHFKRINDTYGHMSGDMALRHFARVVSQVLRNDDSVGRWGGEEFLVLLPETSGENALIVAERVRMAVAARPLICNDKIELTCSIGVAALPRDAMTRDDLVAAADAAMYAAKADGRNRVCSALPVASGSSSTSRTAQPAV